MAGGAPIPIPTADLDEKILSIKDLEKAASKKLAQGLKGKRSLFSSCWPWSLCYLLANCRPLTLSHICQLDHADAYSERNVYNLHDINALQICSVARHQSVDMLSPAFCAPNTD